MTETTVFMVGLLFLLAVLMISAVPLAFWVWLPIVTVLSFAGSMCLAFPDVVMKLWKEDKEDE